MFWLLEHIYLALLIKYLNILKSNHITVSVNVRFKYVFILSITILFFDEESMEFVHVNGALMIVQYYI